MSIVASRTSLQAGRSESATNFGAASGLAPRRVADRRELALEEPDDALERDLLGLLVQPVAARGPALGAHDPGRAHDGHHLLQDRLGSPGAARELLELHRSVAVEGEREQGSRGVVSSSWRPT